MKSFLLLLFMSSFIHSVCAQEILPSSNIIDIGDSLIYSIQVDKEPYRKFNAVFYDSISIAHSTYLESVLAIDNDVMEGYQIALNITFSDPHYTDDIWHPKEHSIQFLMSKKALNSGLKPSGPELDDYLWLDTNTTCMIVSKKIHDALKAGDSIKINTVRGDVILDYKETTTYACKVNDNAMDLPVLIGQYGHGSEMVYIYILDDEEFPIIVLMEWGGGDYFFKLSDLNK